MDRVKGPGDSDPRTPPSGESLDERRVQRAAELVLERELLTGPAPLPDFARVLSARVRRGRVRVALGAAGVVAVAAVVGLGLLKDLSPVSYVVAGQAAIAGTRLSAPSAGEATRIRFSEGTEVTLGPSAELDVVKRTGRGALLALEHGQAHFSVAHRRGARWTVVTGPFAIEVTGTEFTVDWAPEAGRMVVDLKAGSVRVRGASVGGAVELHAGERLVATVSDHRVTLSPSPSPSRPSASAEAAAATRGASAPAEGPPGASAPADGPPAAPAPTRVIVDGSGREPGEPDAPRTLALWTPHEGARLELPEHRVPSLDNPTVSSTRQPLPEGPRTDPAPPVVPVVPSIPQSLTLGGGGLFCVTVPAQYTFEQSAAGLGVPALFTTAFSGPRLDRSHSWCGESSIRVDASFNDNGRQNYFGRFPNETGQLLIKLDHPTDLTGRTVTMHVFVDGPWDARFSAELAVVDRGRWVSNQPSLGLTPGRWWTVSHHFAAENASGVPGSSNPMPFPNGGRSSVSEVDRLALAIRTTGELRTWRGAVFVDDISWR